MKIDHCKEFSINFLFINQKIKLIVDKEPLNNEMFFASFDSFDAFIHKLNQYKYH
jgi:hypothetical protein